MRKIWLVLALGLALCAAPAAADREERVLFLKKSPFSTVVVTQDGGHRMLKFRCSAGDVEESRCDVRRPWFLLHEYLRLQLLALAFAPSAEDALVVGLGGGTLSNQLARAYPSAAVDSLELDPVVVEAARKYFGYREDERHRAHVGDAREFLARTSRRYDIIFLDAFDGLEIPATLRTAQFYQLVQAHLKPGGVVVTNLHLRSPLYASDRNTLASVFENSYAFLGMAQVAVVCQDGSPRSPEWIRDRVKETRQSANLPYPLERLASHLMFGQDWDPAAPVLHDP